MHMADALLSPSIGAAFWAGTLAAIGYSAHKLKDRMDDKVVPLMGVLGAFIFAAQMINFTIPGTGSSGHIGGAMILAVLLGPSAAFLVMASVLTVQAFFFADGGLLALGANIWNLGIFPCFIAYPLIYRRLAGNCGSSMRVLVAALVSVVIGLQLGSFFVVLQTLLSGRSELPFGPFLMVMQPIHLAIGIVEGFVTAGVINYVRHARPEILDHGVVSLPPGPAVSVKKIALVFLALAIVTGGALSWFASTHPDGLEWSMEKVLGFSQLPEKEQGTISSLKGMQEKTSILPDYGFRQSGTEEGRGQADASWPAVNAGTSVAGIIGAVMVLVFTLLIGLGIRVMRRRRV